MRTMYRFATFYDTGDSTSIKSIRFALAAVAATTAFGVGSTPANAVYECTPRAGTTTTYVYYCTDVSLVGGGIVTTAGDLYFCIDASCNKLHLDRNGAGVNTTTRQVCFILFGGTYTCV